MTIQPLTILAFDTSSTCCSVALIAEGNLIGEDTRSGPGNYSALLLQMVDRLLRDAALEINKLDCIAVAQGPGSFTGLRVGISTAQGIGFSLDKPLIGISTLEIVAAQNMPFSGKVCPMLDARRSQVYTNLFEETANTMTALHEESVICPEQWASTLQEGPVLFCGSGAQVYRETIKRTCAVEHYFAPDLSARPNAVMLARIALKRLTDGQKGQQPAQVLPGYVRRPDAERASTPNC